MNNGIGNLSDIVVAVITAIGAIIVALIEHHGAGIQNNGRKWLEYVAWIVVLVCIVIILKPLLPWEHSADIFAIVYEDGTLVFQHGDETDKIFQYCSS